MRELERDATAIAQARQRLLDELGALANQLLELTHGEAARVPKAAPAAAAQTASASEPQSDENDITTAKPPPAAEQS